MSLSSPREKKSHKLQKVPKMLMNCIRGHRKTVSGQYLTEWYVAITSYYTHSWGKNESCSADQKMLERYAAGNLANVLSTAVAELDGKQHVYLILGTVNTASRLSALLLQSSCSPIKATRVCIHHPQGVFHDRKTQTLFSVFR